MKQLLACCLALIVAVLAGCVTAEGADAGAAGAAASPTAPQGNTLSAAQKRDPDYDSIGSLTASALTVGREAYIPRFDINYSDRENALLIIALLDSSTASSTQAEEVAFAITLASAALKTFNDLAALTQGYAKSSGGYYGGYFDEHKVVIGIAPKESALKIVNDFYVYHEIEAGAHMPMEATPRYKLLTEYGRESGEAEAAQSGEAPLSTGTVKGTDINLRSGPGTEHDALKQVSEPAKAVILEKSGEWYKVAVDGTEGYLRGDYINLDASGPEGAAQEGAR